MNDPWKVLGVSRGAGKEEIRKAYLNLVKKYHPDRFQDPAAKEMANEKLKVINLAYDQLTSGEAGGQEYGRQDYTRYADSGADSPVFNQVRMLMNSQRLQEAEALLDSMGERPAEWHFLRGACYSMRGWYAMAREHLARAVQMDPGNEEYRRTLNQFDSSTQGYRQSTQYAGHTRGARGTSACDICSCLICSDCCCECFGGDLIPCC